MDEQRTILTVATYIDLINSTLDTIPHDRIFIQGEIVECRVSQGKWINIELKDEERDAKISCFTTVFKVATPLEAGMKVQVTGYPKVYERFGKLSLNIETVELVGEGALARAYELLKKKLEEEGLFDAARKRNIPRFPKRIGLITSSEAAAYGDFLRILNNRWRGVEIVHIPVHVQGQHAVREIVGAFKAFNAMAEEEKPDVIVLTRGGGSLEDLHAFNDEQTARAVFQSSVPVVCAVGHERDESLCDYVADIRASTPSNAAERVVPDALDVERELRTSLERMQMIIDRHINKYHQNIDRARVQLRRFIEQKMHEMQSTITRFHHAFERFRLSLVATRQYIERMDAAVQGTFLHYVSQSRLALDGLTRVFQTYDVKRVLERGFAIVRSRNGIVRDATQLADGEAIQIQLAKGTISATAGGTQQRKMEF